MSSGQLNITWFPLARLILGTVVITFAGEIPKSIRRQEQMRLREQKQ